MKTIKAKRLAAFLISLVMMLSLIPTTALAAPTSERYGSTAISQLENGENLQWAYDILKAGALRPSASRTTPATPSHRKNSTPSWRYTATTTPSTSGSVSSTRSTRTAVPL